MSLRHSPDDGHPTPTSIDQHEAESLFAECRPPSEIASAAALTLNRNSHLNFLARILFQGFPARYTSQDASQSWFMFWVLQSFSILGAALDPENKQRAINTILATQHPAGGFGGGPYQAAHLLPTCASVCALAIVGRPGPDGGWDQIDRYVLIHTWKGNRDALAVHADGVRTDQEGEHCRARWNADAKYRKGIYNFFMSVKQPDGSFRVARGAEVDIRGTYCALAVATLLDLITPTLIEGVAGSIISCQTYEGGFACASEPYYSTDPNPRVLASPRPPLGEAHGGYTSCALTSWALLRPTAQEEPDRDINITNALRWLAKMQGGEMDIGGFRGRTNKLVDGCYSWWIGGCFPLLESVGFGSRLGESAENVETEHTMDDDWDDVEDDLFNRKALQEYILLAAQAPSGGLRDKPLKAPDAYHTLYNLSGLSAAQHSVQPSPSRRVTLEREWVSYTDDDLELDNTETPEQRDARRLKIFVAAQSWAEDETQGVSRILGGKGNRLNATHPFFNLTLTHSRAMMNYFYRQSRESFVI